MTLINDILDISRIEAGKLELSAAVFRLPECIEGLVQLMRLRAEQKQVDLRYERLTPLPAFVNADEKRVRQILGIGIK